MKKGQHRFLLRDINGNLFRLFSVHFLTDKFDEKYVKFSFPSLSKIALFKVDKKESGEISVSAMPSNITEYSYHYITGRGHWKSMAEEKGKYHEIRNDLKLDDLLGVTLFRITIFDLSLFSKFTKRIVDGNDAVFESVFDGKTISITINILKKTNYDFNFVNADKNYLPISYATVENESVFILFQLYEVKNLPSGKGINIFQLQDPKSNVEAKHYKK